MKLNKSPIFFDHFTLIINSNFQICHCKKTARFFEKNNEWSFPSLSSNPYGHTSKALTLAKLSLETGHCKVFMESEDVGRTLDLSSLSSFDEMCSKLADMFDIKKSDIRADHVHYRDSSGSVKLASDVPFRDLKKSDKILLDANTKRLVKNNNNQMQMHI
ncbi:hypothetical protein ZOSMA_30G01270 [Zostera marina]|uniref:PB1 domain-containing protein n=1 Tax=Zostera marina TaxID=29655 RepID=A0A0K9PA46_ZOSMR|nr:hypothetical protein ZOSMA_30G01270 [Zostera marina]